MFKRFLTLVAVVFFISVSFICCDACAPKYAENGMIPMKEKTYHRIYDRLWKSDDNTVQIVKLTCREVVEEEGTDVVDDFIGITGTYVEYYCKDSSGNYYNVHVRTIDYPDVTLKYIDQIDEETWSWDIHGAYIHDGELYVYFTDMK